MKKPAKGSVQSKPLKISNQQLVIGLVAILIIVIVVIAVSQAPPAPAPPEPAYTIPPTAADIYAGKPVVCRLSELDFDVEIRWEYPQASMIMGAEDADMPFMDMPEGVALPKDFYSAYAVKDFDTGLLYFASLANFGPYWWSVPAGIVEDFDIPSPDVLFDPDELGSLGSFECKFIPDIPDSELELPPGAAVRSFAELEVAMEDPEAFLDQSILDGMEQGYPVYCRSVGIADESESNYDIFFEGSRCAIYDWEEEYMWIVFDGVDWYKNYRVEAGGRKWFESNEEFPGATCMNIYTLYAKKLDAGEIDLSCYIVEDVDDSKFVAG